MHSVAQFLFIGTAIAAVARRGNHKWDNDDYCGQVKHVAIFSFDGMHAGDLEKYMALKPSNFSKVLETGYRYSNAWTSFPSDSFPGTLATFTGSMPRTHGVWYDDTYDRTYFAPGSNCTGPPGAEVVYDETIDYNLNLTFSGGIDPANLPRALIKGKCTPIYPHSRVRVNTVFEVVREAGLVTAYADKHPAYDLVRGLSGTGLSSGYFPEINNAGSPTDNVTATIAYDTLHLNAFLGWLDGMDQPHAEGSVNGQIPALFGGNFQAVSVGQKTKGYKAGSLDFSPDLLKAMDFADASLGAIVNKLKAKNIYDDTLIIVASKHGQAPIDPTKFNEVAPKTFTAEIGVKTAQITMDDVALVFLSDQKDLASAVANLKAHKSDLHIEDIVYGQRQIDLGWGDATKDPAVPDIIVLPTLGTIYTTSKSKIAEHGGGSSDDRVVACFVSHPKLAKKVFTERVNTTQIAPIILSAFGLEPRKLQGVVAEGTLPLPGFGQYEG